MCIPNSKFYFIIKFCSYLVKQWNKISLIAMVLVVIGIITLVPAMADDDDEDEREKKKKIDICHYDNEDGEYEKKTIQEKAVEKHAKNHENDIIPAPEDGCPDQNDEESVGGIDLEMLLGMFTEISIFEQEVDNLQNQIDNMDNGGNGNFIFRHVEDETGSEWNPGGNTGIFLITDEEINSNSVVSITVVKPIGNVDLDVRCDAHIVEMSNASYLLRIDCDSRLPEGTQLNYVIMNPTL